MRVTQCSRAVAVFAGMLWLGSANASGQAAELRVIAPDTSIFCTGDARHPTAPPSGMVCDMLRDMSRRVGHSGLIELYPLQRAMIVAGSGQSVVMAPLARTPARETGYQWLVQLFEEDFVIVSKRGSGVDVASLDQVGRLQIGVMREGVAAEVALAHGWRGLQMATRDVTNALKLDRGRIDAWVGPWNSILSSQRAAGLPTGDLQRGALLTRTRVYLVGSRDLDPAIASAWKKAFDDMVRDGSYAHILHQHGFVPVSKAP